MAESSENLFNAGARVRLISDPGRIGVLTGNKRELAGKTRYQVAFPEGMSFQPEYELEMVDQESTDPFDLIKQGKFGRVSDLRRSLLHIQLSGRLANLVYSMETTNTDFYAYQFKPVLSFLESPSNGILIADEVGLGKTIEAGLIWTELRARYDARRLLVMCPAMLREKWKLELKQRFGINADIVDAAELLNELEINKHEIPDGKALICSVQGLRPPRHWEDEDSNESTRAQLARKLTDLAGNEPVIDLVIVDEAHYLRNPESQTSKLGIMLRDITENLVLLSATPVNLREDDLFHLLKLVDPDTFSVKEFFPQVLEANRPLLEARELALSRTSKAEDIFQLLTEASTHAPLRHSLQLKNILDNGIDNSRLTIDTERVLLANKIEKINLLRHAVSRTRKVEVTEWQVIREPHTELVRMSECEERFYLDVENAVHDYAAKGNVSAGFLLASPQRQISSSMCAAIQAWREKSVSLAEIIYEDTGVDMEETEEISPLIQYLASEVLANHNLSELRAHDSKYLRFEDIVSTFLAEKSQEKIVVFSYFRKTLDYLSARLTEHNIDSIVLVGGMARPKQELIDEFREDNSIRVLLSSEVASEGVDLQFCRFIINYDLPWNPMKIEQRIGRLDRIGQKADQIHIWNLCYENTIDQRILDRLFSRLDIFRMALGGMEAILGEEITNLTNDILCSPLSSEQINHRIDATALAIERNRLDKQALEKEASNLIAHQGYILEQVHAAHDFARRITEHDLVLYVKDYLAKYCQGHIFQQTNPDKPEFRIKLPSDVAVELDEFIRKKHLYGHTRLAMATEVDCIFNTRQATRNSKIEQISQFHPLIKFISMDLARRDDAHYPVIACQLPRENCPELPPGHYGFVISLWTFEGLKTEEEIVAHIISLDGNTQLLADEAWGVISRIRSGGMDWPGARNEIDFDKMLDRIDVCAAELHDSYSGTRNDRETENTDRVEFQVESARRHSDRLTEMHENVLVTLRERGKTGLIPAREGQIRRVKERFELQQESLKKKGELRSSSFEICMGALQVS